MCGICGELRFDDRAPAKEIITRMNAQLARRGPDAEGYWQAGPIQLGHRRLSIIDLSERSNQPMVDQELGLTVVFNGSIYNYPELREVLIQDGYRFFSGGDTEVILKAFHKWGEACVDKLHGMFAFAIWDVKKKDLFLARDRMGIKPFYFSLTDNFFRFASNTQALLAGGEVDTSIDPVGLHHQFTLHAVIPAPHTILKGIRKLKPGHWMRVNKNGIEREQAYWKITATRPNDPHPCW